MHLSLLFVFALPHVFALTLNIELLEEWQKYKEQFDKKYGLIEDLKRMKIWQKTKHLVEQHNDEYSRGLHSYTLGMNHMADMTQEELDQRSCVRMTPESIRRMEAETELFTPREGVLPPIADQMDWRTNNGYVGHVYDQGRCGACWAFSVVGTLESQYYLYTQQKVNLSQQNLIDCDTSSFGCDGGYPYMGFQYIRDNGGINTFESYPYEARDNVCRFKNDDPDNVPVSAISRIKEGSEFDLRNAVATVGPVSVLIQSRDWKFSAYRDGVYDNPNCGDTYLNHAVVVVGYGTENGTDYWIIKNSWSDRWGQNGFGKMARNRGNQCGIASSALYPII
ncbi:procathepsin L-like isoform X3 [Ornithodoros turicata]|uniref:procathepsin L-like isoform X3 n=1 Tax=Ornithodoros turicata TaxID=34597 RepID=UPI0031391B82